MLLFFTGDLDYVSNVLGLPHFNSKENPCSLCLANTTNLQHNDWSQTAAWRGTEVNNLTCRARLRRPLHPLVAHPMFNYQTYRHDLLHMADHHGVISHVCANILYDHLAADRSTNVLPGASIDDRLGFLNGDLAEYYHAHHVHNRLPPFRLENIRDSDWPVLKGNNVKAANTRALVPYVHILQQRAVIMNASPHNRHMLKVIASVHGILDVVYGADVFLTEPELLLLEGHINRLARHYQTLHTQSFAAGQTRWESVTKSVCAT